MSGDPDQEFFADGITEDIITALARYPSLGGQQHGRHRRRGQRHLWRWGQGRGPPRRLGRAGRHLRLGARSGGCGGPPRPRVRRHGRAAAPEHHASCPRIRRSHRIRLNTDTGKPQPCPSRQAVDRGAALRQYERRPGAGISRRRQGRGDHHRILPHQMAVCGSRREPWAARGRATAIAAASSASAATG
jgi:hypothetical protein